MSCPFAGFSDNFIATSLLGTLEYRTCALHHLVRLQNKSGHYQRVVIDGAYTIVHVKNLARGISLLELWVTTFLPD